MGCGAVHQRKEDSCSRCGSSEVKPVYDYLKFFQLSDNYSHKELASAYKKLSLKFHPDINVNGKAIFLLVSEGYQILKDRNKFISYMSLLDQVKSGRTTSSAYTYSHGYGQTYNQRPFTEEDFENIFREFHRFTQPDFNLARVSRITGFLGAILGFLIGLFTGGLLSIFGIFIGYFIGRMNPGLAPFLLKIANFSVAGLATVSGILFLRLGLILPAIVIVFLCYFYFTLSRSWARELNIR